MDSPDALPLHVKPSGFAIEAVARTPTSATLRVIPLPRGKQVAFGEERTSNGSRSPQSRPKWPKRVIRPNAIACAARLRCA